MAEKTQKKEAIFVALMYHNFFNEIQIGTWHEACSYYMTTYNEFDRHLDFLLSDKRIEFMTPQDFFKHKDHSPEKVYIYFTFDDGYCSILNPLEKLKSNGISAATVLVNSGFVDTFELAWPEKLLCFFKSLEGQVFKAGSLNHEWEFSKHTPFKERLDIFLSIINELKKTKTDHREKFLSELYKKYRFDLREFSNDPFYHEVKLLKWKDIKYIADDGFDVGGHTVSHPILSQCSPERIVSEIQMDKKKIESQIGREISVFAIPNGQPQDYNDETVQACKAEGYEYILSTTEGFNLFDQAGSPLLRYDVGYFGSEPPIEIINLADR